MHYYQIVYYVTELRITEQTYYQTDLLPNDKLPNCVLPNWPISNRLLPMFITECTTVEIKMEFEYLVFSKKEF